MARTVPIGPSGVDPTWGATGYITITCPTGGGATPVNSPKISNNSGVHQGLMIGHKVSANTCTNAITFTLKIKDRDGDVIYTSGALNRSVVTVTMSLSVPLIEREMITITPSGEPGAIELIVLVTLYYNPDADIIAWGYR